MGISVPKLSIAIVAGDFEFFLCGFNNFIILFAGGSWAVVVIGREGSVVVGTSGLVRIVST